MRATSFGIGADAEVAGVAGMQRIEQRQAAIAGRNRQREALGEPLHRLARRRRPAAAAEDRERTLCLGQKLAELAHLGGPRRGLDRLKGRSLVGDERALSACPPASAITTGPGRPLVAV